MKFYEALDINLNETELICFVGAGGKTTSLFRLAKELKECEKRVLVTTTTAIYSPDEGLCDEVILGRVEGSNAVGKRIDPCICALGREVAADNKLLGIDREYISQFFLGTMFDFMLVEADGSRQRSIKAPADHEPVIPNRTTKVVGVIGLDSLGSTINSNSVHRPEQFCRLTGRVLGDIIDEKVITKLILAPEGLFKAAPSSAGKYVLLNKADDNQRERSAIVIIEAVRRDVSSSLSFLITDMLEGRISKVV